MTTRHRFLLGLVAVVALIAGVTAWAALTKGLAIGLWTQRRAFTGLGMERHVVATPLGGQIVFDSGQPDDSILVLVHGFGDQAATWSAVVPPLIDRYRLVAPDLPGHGDSAPDGDELSYEQLFAGLERAIRERVGDSPITLVGNSLGGWLSLRYAIEHPEQVNELILVNAAGLQHPVDEAILIPRTREALAEKMHRMFPGEAFGDLPGFLQDQLIAMTDVPRLHTLFASLDRAGGLDDRLHELDVPTTLVWGTPDGFFPIDYARRLQAAIPGAELRELPGCGHVPQMTCGLELTELLAELVD